MGLVVICILASGLPTVYAEGNEPNGISMQLHCSPQRGFNAAPGTLHEQLRRRKLGK